MDTFIQFIHNLQALIQPAHVFTANRAAEATSTTGTSTTSLGLNLRVILVDVIRVLLWGNDLVRAILSALLRFVQ
jgi:hypothetical protein